MTAEVLSSFWTLPPADELLPEKPANPDPDMEYVEVTEIVPRNSWYDFFQFLSGTEENEVVVEEAKPSVSAHSMSLSTSASISDDKPNNPSFSQVMASIMSEKEVLESSEDENNGEGHIPITRSLTNVSKQDDPLSQEPVSNSSDFPK